MESAIQHFVANQSRIDKRRQILRPMMRAVGSLFCQVDATGLEHIPDSGPAIIMMNHISFMDPIIFTAVVTNRFVISMAKAETMNNWFTRGIVHLWGNFIVHRDAVDRAALDNAIALLKSNHLVLIAPEGTRNRDGLIEAKSGTAYIAHKANAIVIPSAICGAQGWASRFKHLRRAYARVHFGRPFRFRVPDNARVTRAVREQMMREAMYQLALAMPDEHAALRGAYRDIDNATTTYIDYV